MLALTLFVDTRVPFAMNRGNHGERERVDAVTNRSRDIDQLLPPAERRELRQTTRPMTTHGSVVALPPEQFSSRSRASSSSVGPISRSSSSDSDAGVMPDARRHVVARARRIMRHWASGSDEPTPKVALRFTSRDMAALSVRSIREEQRLARFGSMAPSLSSVDAPSFQTSSVRVDMSVPSEISQSVRGCDDVDVSAPRAAHLPNSSAPSSEVPNSEPRFLGIRPSFARSNAASSSQFGPVNVPSSDSSSDSLVIQPRRPCKRRRLGN